MASDRRKVSTGKSTVIAYHGNRNLCRYWLDERAEVRWRAMPRRLLRHLRTLKSLESDMFKAIVIDKQDGTQSVRIVELDDTQLPDAPVTVRVEYSTVNYKDGLAITGKSPVVRKFPMVPGIDMAGIVEASASEAWRPGDRVLLNGWGVGEGHWGGFSQKARVKAEWLQRVPECFTTHQAMAICTAGYTASLCVEALVRHGLTADQGDVLVTGASGGVGSVAIALLVADG